MLIYLLVCAMTLGILEKEFNGNICFIYSEKEKIATSEGTSNDFFYKYFCICFI
jgi:hypothetical protein